ncbi:hypothetical protein JCM6882_006874 [Rhodosporidiobolus microsporus]
MSYAVDLTSSLSSNLARLAPSLVHPSSSSSPTSSSANLASTPRAASQEQVDAREKELRTLLAKLRPSNDSHSSSVAALKPHSAASLSPQQLAQLVDAAFVPFQGHGSAPLSPQTETVELVAVAQLTIATYGVVLRVLMEEATRLAEMDEYWRNVESDGWQTGLYLVQTGPTRAFSLSRVALSRFHQLTTTSLHSPPSLFHLETWRLALPPSLFLTSLFPHLSASSGLPSLTEINDAESGGSEPIPSPTSISLASASRLGRRTARNLVFLTLSPLALTRQEIAHQRKGIKKARHELATKIGELTLAATGESGGEKDGQQQQQRGSHLRGGAGSASSSSTPGLATLFSLSASSAAGVAEDPLTTSDLRLATWSTLTTLSTVLAPASSPSRISSSTSAPATPADLAHSLSYLLTRTLPQHTSAFSTQGAALSPPRALVRAWPYALALPLAAYTAGKVVYRNRDSLEKFAKETVETVKGFLVGWVVEPVKKILETLRGGETVGLMGRESLRSDLDSLERMVLDFARDEYRLPADELAALSEKVRSGDLTPVLKAWEKDIKSPIKSAVSGSLIRTLLIQVQKVKVDVALAMDGIDKMLKSQQLTFGFVGVAPSMLVLALVGRWARGFVGEGGGKRGRREEGRRGWMTLRDLDLLLSPPRSTRSSTSSRAPSPALTQGLILLSLAHLRHYARSSAFPSKDTQLRAAFLEDVRAVEDEAARAAGEERRVLVGRLWRWAGLLGWEEAVRK